MESRFAGSTDTGQLRSVNQDHYYIDPKGRFFVVADGMGGHAGGQEASKIATQAIQVYLQEKWDSSLDSETVLKEAIAQANQAILDDQQKHPERGEMGTTAVIVINRQDQFWFGHIGDSRIYQLQDAALQQLTRDHTWVARAQELGHLSDEQARVHPLRHVLLQCLGRPDLHRVDVEPISVKSGDRLLLCSDGLSGEVTDEKICDYLSSSPTSQDAADNLITAANQAGGSDNITVVVVEIP